MGDKFILLRFRGRPKFSDRMHLPRPFRVGELAERIHERKEVVVDLQLQVGMLAIHPNTLYVELRGQLLRHAEDDYGDNAAAFIQTIGTKLRVVAHHAGEPHAPGRYSIALAVACRLDDLAFARTKAELHIREPLWRTLGDAVRDEVKRPVSPVGHFREPGVIAVQRKRLRKNEVHAAEIVSRRNIDHGRAVL